MFVYVIHISSWKKVPVRRFVEMEFWLLLEQVNVMMEIQLVEMDVPVSAKFKQILLVETEV